jgi:hypothetical protein
MRDGWGEGDVGGAGEERGNGGIREIPQCME